MTSNRGRRTEKVGKCDGADWREVKPADEPEVPPPVWTHTEGGQYFMSCECPGCKEKDDEILQLVKELAAEREKIPAIDPANAEYNARVRKSNEEGVKRARQQNEDALREAKEHSVINDALLNEMIATVRKTHAILKTWEPVK